MHSVITELYKNINGISKICFLENKWLVLSWITYCETLLLCKITFEFTFLIHLFVKTLAIVMSKVN